MMTINSGNRDANQTQTLHYNMNTQNDPLSKNIQEQIANAQKQMQEISADTELTPEQKMKKRQELQQPSEDRDGETKCARNLTDGHGNTTVC